MSRIISIVLVVLALAGMGAAAFMTIQVLKPEPEQADEKFAGLSVFAERVQREDEERVVDGREHREPRVALRAIR